ncbi:hypothetical protein [Streptomyces sp. NPDC053069]|uniref:hypothetical protein n=1 Tax=Streptomyces sp. NPDC053069 TaxID=3365695 RepID=UPI0037D6A5C3
MPPTYTQRIAGRVGSLARLICQAAITAICDGTEHITKTSLEFIQLDHLRQGARALPHPPTGRTGMMQP